MSAENVTKIVVETALRGDGLAKTVADLKAVETQAAAAGSSLDRVHAGGNGADAGAAQAEELLALKRLDLELELEVRAAQAAGDDAAAAAGQEALVRHRLAVRYMREFNLDQEKALGLAELQIGLEKGINAEMARRQTLSTQTAVAQEAFNAELIAQETAIQAKRRAEDAARLVRERETQIVQTAGMKGIARGIGANLGALAKGLPAMAVFTAVSAAIGGVMAAWNSTAEAAEKAKKKQEEAAKADAARVKAMTDAMKEGIKAAADEAEKLEQNLRKIIAAVDEARAAFDKLEDSKTALKLAQLSEKEVKDLAGAGGDPEAMAKIRGAANVARAQARSDGETRKAGTALELETGKFNMTDTAAQDASADAVAARSKNRRTGAQLGAAEQAAKAAREKLAASDKTLKAAEQADAERARSAARAGGGQAAVIASAETLAARKALAEAETAAAGTAEKEDKARVAASNAYAAMQAKEKTDAARKEDLAKAAAALEIAKNQAAAQSITAPLGVADAQTAAADGVRSAAAPGAKRKREEAEKRQQEQAAADEAEAKRRAGLPPTDPDQRTAKQKADDAFHDKFKPKGLDPTNTQPPADDYGIRKASLMDRAQGVLGGAGVADQAWMDMFERLLDHNEAREKAINERAQAIRAKVETTASQAETGSRGS